MHRSRSPRRARVMALSALVALGLGVLSAPSPARADPIVLPEPFDAEVLCTELTPAVISFGSEGHRLDVQVLLDGVPERRARAAVRAMREAYEPLQIQVRARYRRVHFEGADARGLIESARKLFGGRAPRGTDVVYTLTEKNISAPPHGERVAGLADCVGGIRSAAHAFAVGELFPATWQSPTLYTTVREPTGKTMAHEIGHLLGAHHHYAAVEGPTAAGSGVFTLMGPALSLISLKFSTLNAAIVRGHLEHRTPPAP